MDGALIYVSNGRLYLAVYRQASDAETAIVSAERDIIQRGGDVARIEWNEPRTLG